MPTFQQTERGYNNLWEKVAVKQSAIPQLDKTADRIIRDKPRYVAVSKTTGVPWFWTACAHDREASGNFGGVLHNGEHIIGKGTKTRLVPAGRGPFSTWEEAAKDALELKGLHKIDNWSIARCLYEWERFNGFGYTARGVNSPYVWAMTNLQQPGKYIADHVWSSTATDTQRGTCAVLLRLIAKGAVKYTPTSVPIVPAPKPEVESPWITLINFIMNIFKGNK